MVTHSCSSVGRDRDTGLEGKDAAEPSSWCRKGGSSSTHESTVPIILLWPFLRCFPAQLRSPAKPCPRVQQQVCQCGDKCGEREGKSEEAGREEKCGAAAPGPFTGTRKWRLKHRGVALTVSRPSAETVAGNGKRVAGGRCGKENGAVGS